MANIVLSNLKELYINGKRVATAFVQGKELKMSFRITFDTNMAYGKYYYISGQGGNATTVAPPAGVSVPIGTAIGTLPSFGNYTYTLSGVSYTIYVEGWYLESSLTNQVTTSWVPTANTTLYAKWKMTGNVAFASNITCPKFAGSIYFDCYTLGGSRSAHSETASSGHVHVVMCAPGAQRNSVAKTFSSPGGKSVTIGTYSCTVGTESASTYQPGAAGSWDKDSNVVSTIVGSYFSGRSGLSAGSRTYSSGNYKVVYSWSKSTGGDVPLVTQFYYANAIKWTTYSCYIRVEDDDRDYDISSMVYYYYPSGSSSYKTVRSSITTFASGTYGADGAAGWAFYHASSISTVSIAAASGTGTYSRTLRVQP